MINLIPAGAKRQINIEYVARLSVVLAISLTFLCVVANVLLVPQIVLLRSQHLAVDEQYQTSMSTKQAIDDYVNQIKQTNEFISILHKAVTAEPLTPYIQNIQSYESEAIVFESINVVRDESMVSTIDIVGMANTRSDLAALKEQLLQDPLIEQVNLPLENLAKDKDLPFNISVRLAVLEEDI